MGRTRESRIPDSGDMNVTARETIDERLLNRMIFFTDAVFAIVLTLMVLDLKSPEPRGRLMRPGPRGVWPAMSWY